MGVHKTNNLNDGYIGNGIYKKSDAKSRDTLFCRAVRKYGYPCFERNILDFFDDYNDALKEEEWIVNKKWVKDKSNYNTAVGGRGRTEYWMSDDRKNEWKSKISAGVSRWLDDGGRDKLSKIQRKLIDDGVIVFKKGVDHHSYGVNSPRRRKILVYDLKMNFIKKYDCIRDAANDNNVLSGNISSCCIGNYKHCGKLVFRYESYTIDELVYLNEKIRSRVKQPKIIIKKERVKKEKKVYAKKGHARYWLGKKRSLETNEKIRISHIGIKPSDETKKKMSLSKLGRAGNGRKPVLVFDKYGNFVKEYQYITEASKLLGLSKTSISNNLIGGSKTCGGFIFKYKK